MESTEKKDTGAGERKQEKDIKSVTGGKRKAKRKNKSHSFGYKCITKRGRTTGRKSDGEHQ